MLETLFESIDSSILTPEVKSDLEKTINEAIEERAEELTEAKLKVKEVELESKFAEYANDMTAELAESVNAYLDRAVWGFVAESKESMIESIAVEKADLVLETFSAALVSVGVDLEKISEAKDSSSIDAKLAERIAKYDAVVEELISKDKEIKELTKNGIINEMKADLSLVESEKFIKLASQIDFVESEDYVAKLDVIKESVKGSKVEKTEEVIDESVKTAEPAWKRFV